MPAASRNVIVDDLLLQHVPLLDGLPFQRPTVTVTHWQPDTLAKLWLYAAEPQPARQSQAPYR